MLYISAQPDDTYFVWQLEMQLSNFRDIGIPKDKIHVLIGYNPDKGLNPDFRILLETNHNGCFFIYPDDRHRPKYLSSIRPNILKKHFKEFPNLSKQTIFYHDSDIIFRERLNDLDFNQDHNWYLSDTRSYISSEYIKGFNKNLFIKVCDSVGIDPHLVEKNDNNAGGAQYIMKSGTYQFWDDVEKYSEKIFSCLSNYNKKLKKGKHIQAWCADMWAVLWNALKQGHSVKIHKELDFCWPQDHISKWYSTKILHNAGVFPSDKHALFCKSIYHEEPPYFVNFSHIDENTCSRMLLEYIHAEESKRVRTDLRNVTLILSIRLHNIDQQCVLDSIIRYWKKNYDIEIFVVEYGDIPRINQRRLYKDISYYYIEDGQATNNKFSITNIIENIGTPYIIFSDADIIVPVENIDWAIKLIQTKEDNSVIRLYNDLSYISQQRYREFKEQLTTKALYDDRTDFPHFNGSEAFIIKTTDYKSAGIENNFRYFIKDGINLERYFRFKILGLKIRVIELQAFKFNLNNKLVDPVEAENNKKEFIRLTSFTKNELLRSFSRTKGFKSQKKTSIPSCITTYIFENEMDNNYPSTCLSEFINRDEFDIEIVPNTKSSDSWSNLLKAIKKAKFEDKELIIICDSLHRFSNHYSPNILQEIIEDIYSFDLEIIASGAICGGIKDISFLSTNIFSAASFSESSFIFLRRNVFDKILKHDRIKHLPDGINLSMISNSIGIAFPYISNKVNISDQDACNIDDVTEILKWERRHPHR